MSARIASLLPAATEWLAEIGVADRLVAVSHECDWPADAVRGRARVTSSRIDASLGPEAIDRAVRDLSSRGEDLYSVHEDVLGRLRVDVIVTQAQCDVCAVSESAVRAIAARLKAKPTVVATSGSTIEGIVKDVLAIGRACEADEGARAAVSRFEGGLEAIRARKPARRRRLVHLEWTDPPMTAASWIPELADLAGFELFRSDLAGKKSLPVAWEEIEAFEPEVVLVAPCGFDLERAELEAARVRERLDARVVAADGNALFNRPGPRLLDSARLLASLAEET